MALTAKERQDIITEIMKTIKVQVDRKREVFTRKSIVINPQNLIKSNPTVYGPYYFNASFQKNPFITFGQVRLDRNRSPLFVQVEIDRWVADSGGITGFYLGVYAINLVPAGLTQHTITMQAIGKASLYKASATNESWNSAYNNNNSGHLTMDDGSLEKPA